MSLIAQYRATEEAIKELQERLQSLSANDQLNREMEFEQKLKAMMQEYGKSLRDINELLDPDGSSVKLLSKPRSGTGQKRHRKLKKYTNPHTGEIIETKGGNHKILKEWKAKWGSDDVETWCKLLD